MVTVADEAVEHYATWPEAHRPEAGEDAICLDRLLHQVWRNHPYYYILGNQGEDWAAKSKAARRILSCLI